MTRALLWLRKGLRMHDNVAMHSALSSGKIEAMFPVFIFDPAFTGPTQDMPAHQTPPATGAYSSNSLQFQFLLECLDDLDTRLRSAGSRLIVAHGNPDEVLPELWRRWRCDTLCFESECVEQFGQERDERIITAAHEAGLACDPVRGGHTLFDPAVFIKQHCKGKVPKTYKSFCAALSRAGHPPKARETIEKLPPVDDPSIGDADRTVPSLEFFTNFEPIEKPSPFRGGETEALKRLELFLADERRVREFDKPKTSPTDFEKPSTTVLSPYLCLGCLSARHFYHSIITIYGRSSAPHTTPPVSIQGQLIWREFFKTVASATPNFHRMQDNALCRQIPWDAYDETKVQKWAEGQTGFPFIDACMRQLKTEGWIHHLARHAVACFLTRGDLWQSWEQGRRVFDETLLDTDYALNNANWMWLSASAFYHQYWRVYSPIEFGRKHDRNGAFVRKYCPELEKLPAKYIYSPWLAPAAVQKQAKCIIGKDYPAPMVDHKIARVDNMAKMKEAYANIAANKTGSKSKAKTTTKQTKATTTTKTKVKGKRQASITSFVTSSPSSSSSSSKKRKK